MPVLQNPRHEAFAVAIFATTCDPKLYPTHGHAYNAAGYRARGAGKAGGSAEVNACNLLKKIKSQSASASFKSTPQSALERQPTSALENSTNSEKTLTQIKPMAPQWPQLWEKPRF